MILHPVLEVRSQLRWRIGNEMATAFTGVSFGDGVPAEIIGEELDGLFGVAAVNRGEESDDKSPYVLGMAPFGPPSAGSAD